MVDPAIFERLQANIDDDAHVREELRNILQKLERQLEQVLEPVWSSIADQSSSIKELESVASKHSYYKYNGTWTTQIRETITIILFCVWLGAGGQPQGSMPTIEEVGSTLKVPTNVKDRDTFHITTEEYLHGLISLIEELARLAVNSVTLGDYQRPLQISKFVKDIHAGFQILNLKNDSLRRRSDSIKYNVKKIEDVVYDLSLRNLVPRNVS
ncbi:MAG: hypothetical protein L6R39_001976 [Caloplaca ligustica]|nr:MAG: hypothetical protein L6R39_001976 [Caloplaca ligustica]